MEIDWKKIEQERQERDARDRAELAELGIDYPRCGFWVDDGWRPTVIEALKKLIAAGWDRKLEQVKQKFCGLRIYLGHEQVRTPEFRKIIGEAEAICDGLCENCGLEREEKGQGWGRAYCNACHKLREAGKIF